MAEPTLNAPASGRRGPGRPTGRDALTRTEIVAAALRVADTDGIDAVSFRRVGSEVGVTAMALYRHVASKEELLGLMMDAVFGEFEMPAATPGPQAAADWPAQLREYGRAFRRLLLAHPSAAELYFGGLNTIFPNGLRVVEPLLELLVQAGFGPQDAALLESVLERNVLALVLFEIRQATVGGPEEREALFEVRRAGVLALPPDEFPRAIAAADVLCGATDPDVAFDFALDLMIAGVEKLLDARTRAPRRAGEAAPPSTVRP